MKYLLIFYICILPSSALAQLSSENFQVDSFSVGTNQSTAASSSNFAVTQETGGLFTLDEDTDDSSSGSRVDRSESFASDGEVLDGVDVISQSDPDSEVLSNPDQNAADGSGQSGAENQKKEGTATSSSGNAPDSLDHAPLRPEISREIIMDSARSCDSFLWCYFWYWWIPLLLLAVYILWRLIKKY